MRMTIIKPVLASALLLAPGAASADPDATPAPAPAPAAAPDLTLHHAPARMHMRAKLQKKEPVTTAAVTKPADASGAGAKSEASTTSTYHPIPTDKRDLQERVIFRVNAGYQLDSAPASGDTLRGGAALPGGFSDNRPWILGDAVVGTRDVLLPSLNSYFLASYNFDASDALASRAATIAPSDATGQQVAIKAGYAEYGTEDKQGGHVWVRAGRQYRQDGGSMFAYFDGATLGYRDAGYAFSAFGGQRVALYIDTPNGTTFGGTAMLDFKKMKNLPFKVGLDYQGLSVDSLISGTAETQLRQLIALYTNIDLGKRAHLDVHLRVVDGGANAGIGLGIADTGVAPSTGGFQFGRASARLRYAASRDVMFVADVQQRGGGDLAYDLATPTAVDVVDIARQVGLGVGLYQPISATQLGAQLDWRKGNHELLGFARANLIEGTAVTADQEGWAEAGAALAGSPVPNTWVTGQYTFRDYFLNNDVNNPAMFVSAFGDTSGSGLKDLHELSLDGWWRNAGRSAHPLRFGAGAFYRIYDLQTPYVVTDTDGRGGARADAQFSVTQELHVRLAGEVAQSSPTLQRDIGVMASVRLALEARW